MLLFVGAGLGEAHLGHPLRDVGRHDVAEQDAPDESPSQVATPSSSVVQLCGGPTSCCAPYSPTGGGEGGGVGWWG